VAFRRAQAGEAVIIVVPRLAASMPEGEDAALAWWGDTRLPIAEGAWRDIITGARWSGSGEGVPAQVLLAGFPVACLKSGPSGGAGGA